MRRKAASKEKSSTAVKKSVEVEAASDNELDEGLENATGSKSAAINSAVAVVSKRGRRKGLAEKAKSSKLSDAEDEDDKAVTVPKRGRKPANKNLGDVKEETTDDHQSEKSYDDQQSEKSNDEVLKVSDSSESQTVNDVPKAKNVPKVSARRGRKKADNEVSIPKSAVEDSSNTEQQEIEQTDDKEINLSSDESDFQLPSHSTTKNAGKNTKKKPGPVKGKKTKDNSQPVNVEENIESTEAEITPVVDDIHIAKDDSKSNLPSKRGRKRKNDTSDTETALSTKQVKDSPSKSDVLEEESAAVIEEEVIEKPKRGRKAVKNIPTKTLKENAEEVKTETVPNTKGRSSKRKVDKSDEDEKETAEKVSKKDENQNKSKKEKIPDVTGLDFSSKSTTSSGKPWNFKISSWNINGIRAWLEKDGISYFHHEKPDILCVQETKCSDEKLPEEVKKVDGYHAYWLAGEKDGYSGVGLLSREKPLSVEYGIGASEHDNEGRVITAEYEKFYLIAAYVPNAGRGLVRLDYRMQWDNDFRDYLKKLDEKKPIILCGDLNVAHNEIDLSNPKTNKKNAGFTKEEREGFSTLLEEGFVDTFRHLYPETKGAYTFWTYMMNARAKNTGWRLDYFVTSERFNENVCDSVIRKDVYGSDHCPITLFLSV